MISTRATWAYRRSYRYIYRLRRPPDLYDVMRNQRTFATLAFMSFLSSIYSSITYIYGQIPLTFPHPIFDTVPTRAPALPALVLADPATRALESTLSTDYVDAPKTRSLYVPLVPHAHHPAMISLATPSGPIRKATEWRYPFDSFVDR